jgi:Domain of unknown function (DUF5615)
MKIRYLFDENVSPRLKTALLRREPAIDVLRIGDPQTPPLGTPDPDILRYLEGAHRALITGNRASMPGHVAAHLAGGGHHWGVFRLRRWAAFRQVIEDLHLLWEASEDEDWIDQLAWIPL